MNNPPKPAQRNWANVLTWSRLVLIAPITALIVLQQHTAAIVLIVLAAITDYFDGIIARKTQSVSAYGSALDGLTDLLFAVATVAWAWIAFPATQAFWPYVLLITASLILLNLVTAVQGRLAPTLHLWTGKVAMTSVFFLIPALVLGVSSWYLHVVGILCLVTQLESFAYIGLGERDPDGRSIILALLSRQRKRN